MKKQEGTYRAVSGYLMLMVLLIMIIATIISYMNGIVWLGILAVLAL